MKVRLFATVLGGMLMAAPLIWAHHSFAAEFDVKQPIKLRGVMTRMDFVNPHAWIFVDVSGPDGKVENWAIESASPTQLLRRGLRKTDFPVGVEVIIEGYKAKSGAPKASGSSMTFADGRAFYLGAGEAQAPQ